MKYCAKCNLYIRGQNKICPLCQNTLSGESDEIIYPKIKTVFRQHELFFKLLILGTATIGIVSMAVNLILPQSGLWSLFVILGLICLWISLALAVKNRNNLSKNIITQVITISLLCILWDYVTGWRGWSLDYVFPIVCMVAMLSLEILAKVLGLKKEDYQVCLTIDIVLGAAPLIFFIMGIISVSIPSIICAAMSAVFFVFTLLFYGKEIKKELIKRFHI